MHRLSDDETVTLSVKISRQLRDRIDRFCDVEHLQNRSDAARIALERGLIGIGPHPRMPHQR